MTRRPFLNRDGHVFTANVEEHTLEDIGVLDRGPGWPVYDAFISRYGGDVLRVNRNGTVSGTNLWPYYRSTRLQGPFREDGTW